MLEPCDDDCVEHHNVRSWWSPYFHCAVTVHHIIMQSKHVRVSRPFYDACQTLYLASFLGKVSIVDPPMTVQQGQFD